MAKRRKLRKPIPRLRISVEKLAKVALVSAFDVSPDGSKVAFSWNKTGKFDVYILDVRSGKLRKLTSGKEAALDPRWSPDGARVCYVSDTAGNENFDIFVMSPSGGEPMRLTRDEFDDRNAEWSPDGRRIAFASNRGGDNMNIYTMNAEDGSDVQRVTAGNVPIWSFAWSPSGEKIAYTKSVFRDHEVWVADLADRSHRKLVDHDNADDNLAPEPWSPDGSRLLFSSNVEDVHNIGVCEVSTGAISWGAKSRWEKGGATWSPLGSRFAFTENTDGNILLKVKRFDDGEPAQIGFPAGCNFGPKWSHDEKRLFFIYTETKKPPDLWMIEDGGKPRQLTHSLPKDIDPNRLASGELVRYRSFDGTDISAWLYKPPSFRPGKTPAILQAHGGPEAQVINGWSPFTQFFASNGLLVISPNYRGSTGYGRKFVQLADRDLGGGDLHDLVASAEYVREKGLAKEIGIYGASYGGYMTMMALTKHPDRWKAGVTLCGFFNWKTAYETEREFLKYYDEHKVGKPEENPQFYYDRSPVNFIENVKAPVLVLHGEKDPRCPIGEAQQIVESLRKQRKRYDYKFYGDEGHGLRKLKNRIDAYKRTLKFLKRNLYA